MIKELRERTSAGMSDCKGALTEAEGDIEKAVEIILKKGIVKGAARAGKIATEGEASAVVSADRARRIVAAIAGARGPVTLPQAGHHLMLDQPLALIGALRALLA